MLSLSKYERILRFTHLVSIPLCLIIEVLSDSTAQKDRTEKLAGYRLIPALQEYVLCSQDFPAIEMYRKRTEWQVERYVSGQNFLLESVNLELPVDELYGFLL